MPGEINQLGEILKGLAKVGVSGAKKVDETIGPDVMAENFGKLLGGLLSTANTGIAELSTSPDKEKLKQATTGTQQVEEQPLTLEQEVGLAAAKKDLTKKFEEAPAPLEEKLKSVGLDEFGKPTQQGRQPTREQQENPQFGDNQQPGAFGSILQGILSGLAAPAQQAQANIASTQADTALKQQQLAGEQPLQKGEREKLEITQFGNLLKTGNKSVSAETAKLLANTKSGIEQIDLLEQAFETDPGSFKSLTTLGNPNAQLVKTTIDDVTDILGRLRSGGAINADEEKRFLGQLPKFGFFKGRTESPQVVKFKLQKLKKMFNEIQSLSQPQGNDIPQRVQAAKQAGFSDEEIRSAFKRQGFL